MGLTVHRSWARENRSGDCILLRGQPPDFSAMSLAQIIRERDPRTLREWPMGVAVLWRDLNRALYRLLLFGPWVQIPHESFVNTLGSAETPGLYAKVGGRMGGAKIARVQR